MLPSFEISQEWNLSKTIRDYEFTRRSEANLKRIVDSREFKDRDSDTIFLYLRDQMEVVSFGDYLKRFIYEKTGMQEPFSEIPEKVYLAWIDDSFDRNRAPHAFSPVQSRWSSIVRRWLSSGSVERTTVFLLGFGLNMTDQEVSMFLMKVLKEQDFDFSDPIETVYWYCFHHGYHYADALEILADLQGSSGRPLVRDEESRETADNCRFWESVQSQLTVYLGNESMLRAYLHYLQLRHSGRQTAVECAFFRVYQRAALAARKLLNGDSAETEEKSTSGAYDIESVLYSGVPRGGSRNLLPSDRSVLVKQFGKKRLVRQHLGKLLSGEKRADRFVILTLLFLDYSSKEYAEGKERFQQFIDEANTMLKECGMWEVYPVNPYESFLLMCLLTGDPLCTYNDVWETSYEQ